MFPGLRSLVIESGTNVISCWIKVPQSSARIDTSAQVQASHLDGNLDNNTLLASKGWLTFSLVKVGIKSCHMHLAKPCLIVPNRVAGRGTLDFC